MIAHVQKALRLPHVQEAFGPYMYTGGFTTLHMYKSPSKSALVQKAPGLPNETLPRLESILGLCIYTKPQNPTCYRL